MSTRPAGDWTRMMPVDARLRTWDSRPGIGVLEVAHGWYLPVFTDGLRLDIISGTERRGEVRTLLYCTNEDAAWDAAVAAQKERETKGGTAG